ncbi:MAG: hypothetical protein Q8O55_08785 [Dehalococcoidales bacterium]|nr:hypothetical protein [Dehalococcoidales bacterium]
MDKLKKCLEHLDERTAVILEAWHDIRRVSPAAFSEYAKGEAPGEWDKDQIAEDLIEDDRNRLNHREARIFYLLAVTDFITQALGEECGCKEQEILPTPGSFAAAMKRLQE